MFFTRLGPLGLIILLSSGCATLERLVPNNLDDAENPLPASVKPISEQKMKEREQSIQSIQNSVYKKKNIEQQQKILSLEEQFIRQDKAFEDLQDQWTTNFSLMEKAVADTLRENQQLIAELQQSIESFSNNAFSETPQAIQNPTLSKASVKPVSPNVPTTPPISTSIIQQSPPPNIPVVEEVSLAALHRKPQPSPTPEMRTLLEKKDQSNSVDPLSQTNLTMEKSSQILQNNDASSVDENVSEEAELFADSDLNEPTKPLFLIRRPRVKKLYNRGMSAFIQGNFPEAVNVFEGFVDKFEDDVDSDNAYYWIGYSQFKLGRWDEAEAAFRKVLQKYEHRPTSQGFKTPDAIYMLGKLAENREQSNKAVYYFENVLENYPGSAAANNALEDLRALR
jgi:TolA-binding protein